MGDETESDNAADITFLCHRFLPTAQSSSFADLRFDAHMEGMIYTY